MHTLVYVHLSMCSLSPFLMISPAQLAQSLSATMNRVQSFPQVGLNFASFFTILCIHPNFNLIPKPSISTLIIFDTLNYKKRESKRRKKERKPCPQHAHHKGNWKGPKFHQLNPTTRSPRSNPTHQGSSLYHIKM